jgi:hypothetical protein
MAEVSIKEAIHRTFVDLEKANAMPDTPVGKMRDALQICADCLSSVAPLKEKSNVGIRA